MKELVLNEIKGLIHSEYTSELTKEMDTYLLHPHHCLKTYMVEFETTDKKVTWVIRYPGATRGCMVEENGIITEIKFYQDSCYETLKTYRKEMESIIDKYIGLKVVVNRR